MGYNIIKTEGGHKKGRSNMNHREYSEIIKKGSNRVRRSNDKKACKED
jgi:hypothetical protein